MFLQTVAPGWVPWLHSLKPFDQTLQSDTAHLASHRQPGAQSAADVVYILVRESHAMAGHEAYGTIAARSGHVHGGVMYRAGAQVVDRTASCTLVCVCRLTNWSSLGVSCQSTRNAIAAGTPTFETKRPMESRSAAVPRLVETTAPYL